MARKNDITVRSGIMIDGQFTEIKDLTEEQHSAWVQRQMDRASRALENHFKQHPDELADFVKLDGVTVEPI